MKSSETAFTSRKGYAIFIDTVCDGSTPVLRSGDGEIVIFETEIEAQREVADHQMTRLQEFLDGEREFDDAMSVDEYVLPVMVRPGGV
ncbi:hypothetical protein [Haloferula sp. A504]|uniref:hypothetical protein n=1 Tax=Haloferula sp. A504 TaxID=3373601 RepID=UPI0031BE744F|nr:hypothetical protein [Verrucomicrobiaceae bacterium E54]